MLYAKWAKKSSSTTTSTSPKTGDPICDIVAALSATAAVALCLALLAASRRRWPACVGAHTPSLG